MYKKDIKYNQNKPMEATTSDLTQLLININHWQIKPQWLSSVLKHAFQLLSLPLKTQEGVYTSKKGDNLSTIFCTVFDTLCRECIFCSKNCAPVPIHTEIAEWPKKLCQNYLPTKRLKDQKTLYSGFWWHSVFWPRRKSFAVFLSVFQQCGTILAKTAKRAIGRAVFTTK